MEDQIINDDEIVNKDSEDIDKKKEKKEQRIIDPYLESLVFLANFHQKTVSKDSLVTGVLTQGEFMNLNRFIKASHNIGLICEIVSRDIEHISKLALPMLLVLKNNRACVLLDFDLQEDKVKVMLPGLSGETVMSVEKLTSEFTNRVVLKKNKYQFKNRLHKDIKIENPRDWFLGTMKKNKKIYSKVAMEEYISDEVMMQHQDEIYYCIATNDNDLTPQEIIKLHRQRGDTSENKIKELKNGFNMSYLPSSNNAFYFIESQ